ncbi:7873_t:CDS:2 [Entrophospora sp. SA101]|nr:7873_t:CDS:2 [Entrophospora sp. SA101]
MNVRLEKNNHKKLRNISGEKGNTAVGDLHLSYGKLHMLGQFGNTKKLDTQQGSKGKGLYDVEESDDEHEDSEDDEYSEDEDESNKNIEDTLFEYAKNLEHEDDENVKKLFTKQEWDELTQENLEAFEIPDDILEHLKFYNQDTMEGVRSKLMKPYLKNDENYDTNSNYDYEWIHLSIRSVINLWENKDSPLSRTQYENWYSVNLFGSPSGNRKNRAKEKGARKRVGRKIDGIIYKTGKNLELGVFESANIFKDEHDNKYLKESFKLPKSMRDIYCSLARYIKYEEEKGNSNTVHYLSPRFTKLGLNDYLKLLAKIYSYKLLKQQITKNNLQILGLCDPAEESDLLEELKNIDREKTPPPTIEYFIDCWMTPVKPNHLIQSNLKRIKKQTKQVFLKD